MSDEPAELLTQVEAAKRLAITTRQLRRIPDEITKRRRDGKYPWPAAQKGYVRWKQEEELGRRGLGHGSEYDRNRARKAAAQALLAELEVAQRMGELLPQSTLRQVVGLLFGRLSASLNQVPGAWSPLLVGVDSPREVAKTLQGLVQDLVEDLRTIIDDLVDPEDLAA